MDLTGVCQSYSTVMHFAGPADGTRGNSSSAAAAAECSSAGGGDAAAVTGVGGEEKGEVQVNGLAASPEEEELAVSLDDLPPVLNVADPVSGCCTC